MLVINNGVLYTTDDGIDGKKIEPFLEKRDFYPTIS